MIDSSCHYSDGLVRFVRQFQGRIGTDSWSFFSVPFPLNTPPSARVRFGAFELDLTTGELRSSETPGPNHPGPNNKVLLREQVFQVLRMLLEREGKIVTREQIKARLWPNDTVVDFDHSINATINALR